MDRKSGTLIAFLTILCLILAYATVTQSLARSEQGRRGGQPVEVGPKGATPASDAGCAMVEGGAACPLQMPSFEALTVDPKAAKAKFVGEWLSANEGRRGLTRVTITQKPDGLAVVPWALHCAGEKPYGSAKQTGPTTGNPFELKWEAGFAEQRMRFALLDDGRLRVDSIGVVMDPAQTKSGVITDYLTRATPEALKAHEQAQRVAAAQLTKAEEPPETKGPEGAKAGGT